MSGAGTVRRRVFRVPAAIALVSAVGLVSALVGDGVWDTVSWLGLGIPAVVGFWWGWARRQPS